MKKILLLTAFAIVAGMAAANAQNVNIPDPAFKNYLLNNPAINTNGDNEIQESEAAAFTGTIYYNGQGSSPISDLTGIAAFTALTRLEVPYNSLDTLYLSANTALTYLDCSYNILSALDVNANSALTYLNCSHNTGSSTAMGENDNGNSGIYTYTGLYSLSVGGCTALTYLDCSYNSLTTLDLNGNSVLTYLNCAYNVHSFIAYLGYIEDEDNFDLGMNALSISNCTALDTLICRGNGLDTLNVSTNTALTYLDCSHNGTFETSSYSGDFLGYQASESYTPTLVSLEIGGATALTYLNCSGNHLYSLDISANAALVYLDCSENGGYSYSNYGGGSFGGDGSSSNYTGFLNSLNTTGAMALAHLDCSGNALSALDVSSNTALTYLNCSDNRGHHIDTYYGYWDNYNDVYNEYYTPHLLSLNMKNGNNALLEGQNFNATSNSYLGCIKVDDMAYAQSNWSGSVDATASFSEEECPANDEIAVTVATENNVPAEITTDMGTLQMTAIVTPGVFTQQVSWSIVPVSGYASVSEGGLVTALENGTVYAKAVSVINPDKSDSMLITISSQISVSIATANNAPAAITEDLGTLQMTAIVLPADTNQQVTWSVVPDYDDIIPGNAAVSENGLITALGNGSVVVKAQSILNPNRSDSMLIYIEGQIPDGINGPEPSANNHFSLYPNPNKGNFVLESEASGTGSYTVMITNVLGQEVYAQMAKASGDKLRIEITAGDLAPGTYSLALSKDGERIAVKKFMVMR